MSTSRCCCQGGPPTPICCPSGGYQWAASDCSFRFDGAAPNQNNEAITTGNYILGTVATVSVNPALLTSHTMVKIGLTNSTEPQCAYATRFPQPTLCQPPLYSVGNPFLNGTAYQYQGTDRVPVTEYFIYYWVTPWIDAGVAKWELGLTIKLRFVNPLSSTYVTFATISNGAVSGTVIAGNSCPTGLTLVNSVACGRSTQTLQRGHARTHIDTFNYCTPPNNSLPGFHPFNNTQFFCPVSSSFVGTVT